MREGFVVRFESGHRVKIKFDDYKRLHKLLTGVSPCRIWDALRHGNDLGQLMERVPDEYFEWVRNTESELLTQFAVIESKVRAEFLSSPQFASRKEAALHFQQCQHPSILFAMLDEKDYSDQIWRLIRPSGRPAFRCDMDN